MSPDDLFHDQFAAISASASRIGNRIARLHVPAKKKSQGGSPSVLELRDVWTALEDELRVFRGGYRELSAAEELPRLRDAASRANAKLADIRALLRDLSVGGKNKVVAAEQAAEVRAIAASATKISLELKAFRERCTPLVDDEFRAYFERLAQSIPVQSWYEGRHGVPKLCTEVPW
ncbi:MAG TPA: hypothetical protein VNG33_09085, partial [Polyangiaceae bacterium]|nr:hypothetical protein [Polyangiaceae bacterium]